MKIALIRRRYSPHGGAEKYVDRLAQKLLSLGHEVHLFSTEWPRRPGLVLHPLPLFRGPGLFKLFHFNRKVEKAVDRKAFEVIQSFEKTACQDIYRAGEGCHREWLQQRKKYEPFHKSMGAAINPFHWLTLALEKRLFERSDTRFFIANSQTPAKSARPPLAAKRASTSGATKAAAAPAVRALQPTTSRGLRNRAGSSPRPSPPRLPRQHPPRRHVPCRKR